MKKRDDPTCFCRAAPPWAASAGSWSPALASWPWPRSAGFPTSFTGLRNELVKILGEADPLPALGFAGLGAFFHPSELKFDKSVALQGAPVRRRLAALIDRRRRFRGRAET